MSIKNLFSFGVNNGLTLQQIYQGTYAINEKQLSNFLINCLNSELVPKPNQFLLCELKIVAGKIEVIPEILDPNKAYSNENQVNLGDIGENIEIYFNNFFKSNWYGIITDFQKFNSGEHIIGGNPEYILWCINNIDNFNIDLNTIRELESLKVYRLKGIKVEILSINQYRYKTIIEEESFSFKMQLSSTPYNNENNISECDFPF